MSIRPSLMAQHEQLAAMSALWNAGAVIVYDGDRPGGVDDELAGQRELVRVQLPSPAFNPPAAGEAIGHAWPDTEIAVSGIARWARVIASSGRVICDMTVGTEEDNDDEETKPTLVVNRLDFTWGGMFRAKPLVMRAET